MAENDVKEWIPSTTGDYTGGKVTFTAGSKGITFENAFNGGEHSFTAGDSIYIPTEGRWLLLKEITSTTKGTLLYPCPESCAGTFDLRIRQLSRNARQAGLAAMILRNLNTGNLAGLANVKLKTGQILVASQIDGSFDAIDLNADNVAETDKHKVMTGAERNKLSGINELEQKEWNGGTNTTEALISPSKLANVITSNNKKNTLEQKEWNSGTNTTEALVSPAKLKNAIMSNIAGDNSAGWVKLSNGLIIQWGLKLSNNSAYGQVFFPTAYTTIAFFYPVMLQAWTNEGFAPIVFADWQDNQDLTKRGFHCRQINGTSGVSALSTWNVAWIAIGY